MKPILKIFKKSLLSLRTTYEEPNSTFKMAEENRTDALIIKPKHKSNPGSVRQSYDGVRIRGTLESKAVDARGRAEAVIISVHEILNHFKASCQIPDLRRQGKYNEKKKRTIVLKMNNP